MTERPSLSLIGQPVHLYVNDSGVPKAAMVTYVLAKKFDNVIIVEAVSWEQYTRATYHSAIPLYASKEQVPVEQDPPWCVLRPAVDVASIFI